MYEHRREPLASRNTFLSRLARSAAVAAGLIAGSLLVGVVGYHALGRFGWVDATYNASMILGGMGPVDRLDTDAGKLFASGYALFSGFALLTSVGVLLVPALHRFMHRFHLETAETERETKR
jgi:hypothetical protein